MWNYLKGLFLSGGFFRRLVWTLAGFFGAAFFIAVIFGPGKNALPLAAVAGMWAGEPFLYRAKKVFKNIEHVPYWGNKFGTKNTIALLEKEKFRTFRPVTGKPCSVLKVSESGRWFSLGPYYYPYYLVRDFDKASSELVMIDGNRVSVASYVSNPNVEHALSQLLDSNRVYEKGIRKKYKDSISATAFLRVWDRGYEELALADWDEIRYAWEKEVAELAADRLERSNYNKFRYGLKELKSAEEALLTRVLAEEELDVIVTAVRQGVIKETSLSNCLVIGNYKDDLCVCNGVHLLYKLKRTGNKAQMKFLFDCLSDIQKPYFQEAVDTLKRFNRDELIEEIEKQVAIAHDEGDVLRGAGLIYLAKQIDYEISLTRNDQSNFREAMPFAGGSSAMQAQTMPLKYPYET